MANNTEEGILGAIEEMCYPGGKMLDLRMDTALRELNNTKSTHFAEAYDEYFIHENAIYAAAFVVFLEYLGSRLINFETFSDERHGVAPAFIDLLKGMFDGYQRTGIRLASMPRV